MLDPKARRVLLPQDREIIALTGMTEEQYIQFLDYCAVKNRFEPGEIVALEPFTIIMINLAIGLLLTGASMLLAPKPQEPKTTSLDEEKIDGQDIVRKDRFAPKSGFDSIQNVVNLGSVIPIVYAKRETISGNQYGGIRINTNMIWSQLQSIGGGQFFRGIFMVGEASNVPTVPEGPIVDFAQTALGNNTLASYYLTPDQTAGRATIYYSPGNGRIEGGRNGNYYQLGVVPEFDPGNKEENTPTAGADVYCIESNSETPTPAFCQAIIPSNQSTFGVYGFCANRFAFKLGERFEALTQWQSRADGEYERQDSNQKVCQNLKERDQFACRAGFTDLDREDFTGPSDELETVEPGDTLTYSIFASSDLDHVFTASGSSSGGEDPSEINCKDVATTIASLQRGYDERINVGDLYRAGSALVICTSRSAVPFKSDADVQSAGSGTSVTHQFKVLEGGQIHVWQSSTLQNGPNEVNGRTATESSHLLQTAIASFSLERPARTIEIGFKSVLGLKSSGIANFNSLTIPSNYSGEYDQYQEYVDSEFCGGQEDGDDPEDDSYRKEILAGKYSSTDDRYSFFLIQYLDSDEDSYVTVDRVFGIRSQTSQPVYNYLRIRFPDSQRREMRFIPVSGWEIRNSIGGAASDLCILDPHIEEKITITTSDGASFIFNGIDGLARTSQSLGINAFGNLNSGKTSEITSTVVEDAGSGYPPNLVNRGDISLVEHATGTTTGRQAKCRISTNAGGTITTSPITRSGEDYSVDDLLTVSTSDLGFNNLPVSDPKSNPFTGTAVKIRVTAVAGSSRNPIGTAEEDDGSYYVDAFARVAEAFWYSEVTNTANQPENSISYVNIIDDNETTPEYEGVAILGLNIRSTKEISSLNQVSVYIERGVIDSHLFPDVFTDLLTNSVYGVGGYFDRAQIDTDSFSSAATYTNDRKYFFDGAISEKINLRSWASDMASNFLLDLGISGGRFTLSPVVNFTGPETVTALMTAGNIIEGSFEANYFDTKDRLLPRVSVKWREERRNLSIVDRGLFPQIREVLVTRTDAGDVAPTEQIDMSAFCTNENHAIDRAKWLSQQRKYITHSIRFKTIPNEAAFQVGSVIKVAIETITYQPATNGAINETGVITSWEYLPDGIHTVLLWNGIELQEKEITVENQKTNDAVSSVFCLKSSDSKAEGYKVQSVAFDEDGNIDVTAIYWPLDENDHSMLKSDFADNFFTIER